MAEIRPVNNLAWKDVDIYGLKLVLEKWASRGFVGELDMKSIEAGFITIVTANWRAGHPPYAMMQLHKLAAGNGWFGTKTKWVVQLCSCHSLDGALPVKHGCVTGRNLLAALENAVKDIGYDFMSWMKFEDCIV